MSANNILDYLTMQDIYDCELKRIRSNFSREQKADLVEYANYDLIFSKTKQGTNHNDCFKLTFGKCEAVKAFQSIQDKLWIRTFLIYPYMFFEISPVRSEHARTLSFQAGVSSDGKTTNRGTLVQKIVCETAAEKAMIENFIGKYRLALDMKTNLYYINAFLSMPF